MLLQRCLTVFIREVYVVFGLALSHSFTFLVEPLDHAPISQRGLFIFAKFAHLRPVQALFVDTDQAFQDSKDVAIVTRLIRLLYSVKKLYRLISFSAEHDEQRVLRRLQLVLQGLTRRRGLDGSGGGSAVFPRRVHADKGVFRCPGIVSKPREARRYLSWNVCVGARVYPVEGKRCGLRAIQCDSKSLARREPGFELLREVTHYGEVCAPEGALQVQAIRPRARSFVAEVTDSTLLESVRIPSRSSEG